METDKLIATLAADARLARSSFETKMASAIGAGLTVIIITFAFFLGPRADIASAALTWPFLLKPAIALLLFLGAVVCLRAIARPAFRLGWTSFALLMAPALLGLGLVIELTATPADRWFRELVGNNALACLTAIPALAALPLLGLLLALRHGATVHPRRAGALAGLAAAGLAAAFYALNCTDDSPLFVATWYSLAAALVASAGAVLGGRWLRW